ncbi:MAG: winged helix-turn-helix transcriptional regulator [Sphingobacteriaceae bacterium]|nr:winged helix-turn-helix transcriptional regulator [Sphingobacteriaceae bacterium]
MVSILTGDIINSRKDSVESWLNVLKAALQSSGTKKQWEIYRGDSFQLETAPEDALLKAIYLKACVKTVKNIDARIAIGIGGKNYTADKISESNGEAFVFSGEKFDELKKERVTLAIQTPWETFNYEMNVIIRLALIAIDNWSQVSAEMVKLSIENAAISQLELAELSNKSQSTVSEALKRARLAEILELDTLYRRKLTQQLNM